MIQTQRCAAQFQCQRAAGKLHRRFVIAENAPAALDHSLFVRAKLHPRDRERVPFAESFQRGITGFELAGEDGQWKAANVLNYRKSKGKDGKENDTDYIDGAEIVLSSDEVAQPVKVRYMGQPRTSGTLYNEASLPLGPFEAK